MPSLIETEGFAELAKALASTGKEMRKELNIGLRGLAEPIANDAEHFAVERIPHMTTLPWSRMRVGITRGFSLVYVAPKQRGLRGRGGPRARPKFADLLRDRAMDPAAAKNEADLVVNADRLVETVIGRRLG